jgi:putative phage-type endonuclease
MDKYIYTEKELPQKSDAWLEMRKTCIGGSDAATVLGINIKYDSAYDLWQRKTGKRPPKKMNKAMQRGADMEKESHPSIKDYLKTKEGVKAPKIVPYFARHPDHPYVGISFDGVDIKNKFITEIKCPMHSWNFKSVFENGIQDYYYPQVQLQLFVANKLWGIDKAYFCSYYPDGAYILNMFEYKEYLKTLAVLDIDYDEEYCNRMNVVIKKFWDFVQYDYWNQEEYNEVIDKFNEI